MTENWLPVVGYEGLYEVSDRGRVRSLARVCAAGRKRKGRILSQSSGRYGHRRVVLYRDAVRTQWMAHVLVLTAFVGPRPEGMECCHGNGNPADNRVENLRWDTRSANQRDSVRAGTHGMTRRTHCPQGHEYTEQNTSRSGGTRKCKECRRAYREKHIEEIRADRREYMRLRRARERAA